MLDAPKIPYDSDLPDWLIDAIVKNATGKPVEAVDIIFDRIDRLCTESEWNKINAVLQIPPMELSTQIIMAILSISRPARQNLPSFGSFHAASYATLESRGRDAKKLLDGFSA